MGCVPVPDRLEGGVPEDFFDFKQIDEQEDNLDYNNLADCPHCKKPIPQDSIICYYCGKEVYFDKKPSWSFWLVLVLIVLLIGCLFFF